MYRTLNCKKCRLSGEAVSAVERVILLLPPQHSFNSNLDAGGIAKAAGVLIIF
jgi:hypothetical protein